MLVSEIKVLSAGDLSNVVDREEKLFEVTEWNGSIKLRTLSVSQRDKMLEECTVNGAVDGQKLLHKLCIYGVCDPVLTEAMLADKSFMVIDKIATAVMEMNGMGKKGEAALSAARTF